MIKLYGNPYSRANRVRWALEASDTPYEEETIALGPDGTGSKRFTIADLIVSEVLTNVVHAKVDLSPFPAVKHYLEMNLSQVSAKKAFAADIIKPYLT